DILSPEAGAQMQRCLRSLLHSLRADPDLAIGEAAMVAVEDADAMAAWNSTVSPWPAARSLPALLEAQALATPERTALRFGDAALSYADLHARARRIANALRARGVGSGDLVGICLDRHPDMVAALLAVL